MEKQNRLWKDVEIARFNGYVVEMYKRINRGGNEHEPPHIHVTKSGRKGKFYICNNNKGFRGQMYDGNMNADEQKEISNWINSRRSRLNRLWRTNNFMDPKTGKNKKIDSQLLVYGLLKEIWKTLSKMQKLLGFSK